MTIRFLRHSLILMLGFVKQAAVYDAVQKIAKSSSATVAFANNLESFSNTYSAIHIRNHEKWNTYPDGVRKSIDVLSQFGVKPIWPMILASAHSLSENEANKVFQLMIAASVRLIISGIPPTSGSVENPMYSITQKVFKGEIISSDNIKQELSSIIPNDEQFRLKFELDTVSDQALARYYLRCLEAVAKNIPEPWFFDEDNSQSINLEHILPKKPENNWPQFSIEDRRTYTHRIGNLALLQSRANRDLKNFSFKDKKSAYENAPYVLTKQISDVEEWNPVAISDRQKNLAELAVKAWPF